MHETRSFRKALACSLLVLGCGGDGPTEPTITVATLTMNPSTVTLGVGQTVQLAATAKDASGTPVTTSIAWTSSDPAVASVNGSGMVSGLSVGNTTVSAEAEGVSLEWRVG